MILYYQMTLESYPNPNEVVGGSIPDSEIFSLLDVKTSQVATLLKFFQKNKM